MNKTMIFKRHKCNVILNYIYYYRELYIVA